MEDVLKLMNKEDLQELRIKRKREELEDSKFLKAMSNQRIRKNREIFSEIEPKLFTCKMYNPCAICDKCQNKASHLYVRCQNCEIPQCVHKHENREMMIKRDNFKIKVSKEAIQQLRKLSEKYEEEKKER